jgi:hypothetical protein
MHCKARAAVLLFALVGCSKTPLVQPANAVPRANAGPDQMVPATGMSVSVTLDGSQSSDSDGHIVEYRWLSATKPPDGGSGRYVPPGQMPSWPDDEVQPKVSLPEGVWTFSLQVTDDKGATSVADTVTITVGNAPVAGAPAAGAGAGGMGGDAG